MTKKVICTLPNASDEINGVKFEIVDGVAIADGVSDKEAEQFEGIDGYTIEDSAKKASTGKKAANVVEPVVDPAAGGSTEGAK